MRKAIFFDFSQLRPSVVYCSCGELVSVPKGDLKRLVVKDACNRCFDKWLRNRIKLAEERFQKLTRERSERVGLTAVDQSSISQEQANNIIKEFNSLSSAKRFVPVFYQKSNEAEVRV